MSFSNPSAGSTKSTICRFCGSSGSNALLWSGSIGTGVDFSTSMSSRKVAALTFRSCEIPGESGYFSLSTASSKDIFNSSKEAEWALSMAKQVVQEGSSSFMSDACRFVNDLHSWAPGKPSRRWYFWQKGHVIPLEARYAFTAASFRSSAVFTLLLHVLCRFFFCLPSASAVSSPLALSSSFLSSFGFFLMSVLLLCLPSSKGNSFSIFVWNACLELFTFASSFSFLGGMTWPSPSAASAAGNLARFCEADGMSISLLFFFFRSIAPFWLHTTSSLWCASGAFSGVSKSMCIVGCGLLLDGVLSISDFTDVWLWLRFCSSSLVWGTSGCSGSKESSS